MLRHTLRALQLQAKHALFEELAFSKRIDGRFLLTTLLLTLSVVGED